MPKEEKNPLTETMRALTRISGANPSEIRTALFGTPLQDTLAKVQSALVQSSAQVAPPPTPQIQVTEQSLNPQPFRNPAVQSTGDQIGAVEVIVTACQNGIRAAGVALYRSAPAPIV